MKELGTLLGILDTCFHGLLTTCLGRQPQGAEETDSKVTAHCHTDHHSFRIQVRWDRCRESQVLIMAWPKGMNSVQDYGIILTWEVHNFSYSFFHKYLRTYYGPIN